MLKFIFMGSSLHLSQILLSRGIEKVMMMKNWNDIIKSYLNEDDPFFKFRDLLLEMKSEGISSEVAYTYFNNVRKELKDLRDEKNEDKILDAMDIITGWVAPHLIVW